MAADANEFLIALKLGFIVQHVLVEHAFNARAAHVLGQHEEREPALGTIAAPAFGRRFWVDLERAIATGEGVVVARGAGHQRGDMRLRERAQKGKIVQAGMNVRSDLRGDVALGLRGLGILMVHFAPVHEDVALIGRAFVGQHDCIEAFHKRGGDGDEADDCRDRHMPVEGALVIQREQKRVEKAGDLDERQAACRRTIEDRLFRVDREQRHGLAACAQGLDADKRILAAAHQHSGPAGQGGRGRQTRRAGSAGGVHEIDSGRHIDAVAHAKFAQPIHIKRLEEAPLVI